jgi:hypothetical protein
MYVANANLFRTKAVLVIDRQHNYKDEEIFNNWLNDPENKDAVEKIKKAMGLKETDNPVVDDAMKKALSEVMGPSEGDGSGHVVKKGEPPPKHATGNNCLSPEEADKNNDF